MNSGFELVKRFKKGREDFADNSSLGHSQTANSNENNEKVGKIIQENRCLSITQFVS